MQFIVYLTRPLFHIIAKHMVYQWFGTNTNLAIQYITTAKVCNKALLIPKKIYQ